MQRILCMVAMAALVSSGVAPAVADGSGDPAAVTSDGGAWSDKDGTPTFKVEKDGSVDWNTYVGFTRYSAECLRCHGPDGLGSTYAPALTELLQHLSFTDFYTTVASGKQAVSSSQNLVMPAEGQNKNVMCFINQIYIYLRARSDGAVGRGRPEKHASKPAGYEQAVDGCME